MRLCAICKYTREALCCWLCSEQYLRLTAFAVYPQLSSFDNVPDLEKRTALALLHSISERNGIVYKMALGVSEFIDE